MTDINELETDNEGRPVIPVFRQPEMTTEEAQVEFLRRMQASGSGTPLAVASPDGPFEIQDFDKEVNMYKTVDPMLNENQKLALQQEMQRQKGGGILESGPAVPYGAPALGQPTITYEPGLIPGTMQPAEIKPNLMFINKIAPIVGLEDVYDISDADFRADIESYTGFRTRERTPGKGDGQVFEFGDRNFDERVRFANQMGAVSFYTEVPGAKEDLITTIPYDIGIANRIGKPRDYKARQMRIQLKIPKLDVGIPPTAGDEALGFEYLTFTVPNFAEPELRDAEAITVLAQNLVALSDKYPYLKDDRTRLGIIDYMLAKDQSGTDFGRVAAEYGRPAARFAFDAAGYLVFEGSQAISKVLDKTLSIPSIPEVGPFSSIARQEKMGKIFPSYSHELLQQLANRGVEIDLPLAQYLARYDLGIGVSTAGAAVETFGPSLLAALRKTNLAKREYAAFDEYRTRRIAEGAEDSVDLVNDFITLRMRGQIPVKIGDSPFYGFVIQSSNKLFGSRRGPVKWARMGLVSRLSAGSDLNEALTKAPNLRVRAQAVIQERDRTYERRSAMLQRAKDDNDRPFTEKEQAEFDALTKKLQMHNHDLMAEVARGDMPPFLQQSLTQDVYMTIGAATGNNLITEMGGDPEVGELVGIFSGLIFSMTAGSPAVAKDFVSKLMPGSKKPLDLAAMVAENINSFDPAYREAILARVNYMNELRNELLQTGEIDADTLDMTIGQLTGLAVLQALDSTVKQDIAVRKLGNFDEEVINKIDLQTQSEQLNSSLEKILASMATKNFPDGSAGDTIRKMAQEGIDYIQLSMIDRKKDIEIVMGQLAIKVNRMLDNSSGQSEDLQGTSTNSMLGFDQALERLAELGYVLEDDYTVAALNSIAEARKSEAFNLLRDRVAKHRTDLVDVSGGQKAIDNTLPSKGLRVAQRSVTVGGPGDDKFIPRLDSGPKLLHAWTEIAHFGARENATAPFRVMDKQPYVRVVGDNIVPVGGSPKADVSDLIADFLDTLEIDDNISLLNFMTKKDVSPTVTRSTVDTANEAAIDFFIMSKAADENVDEVIKEAVDAAKDDPGFADQLRRLRKLPGNKDGLIAASYQQYLAKANDFEVANMNISMLAVSRMNASFRELAQKANAAGNATAAKKYGNLAKAMERKFDEAFVLDAEGNKVDIGELRIQTGPNMTESVIEFRKKAREGFMNYKNTWYDNPVLSSWMGWGRRAAKTPDGNHPFGIRLPLGPEKWLDWSKAMSDGTQAGDLAAARYVDELMATFEEAAGVPRVAYKDKPKINPDSPEGQALSEVLQANLNQWLQTLVDESESAGVDVNAIDNMLMRVKRKMKGVNDAGEEVDLFPNLGKNTFETKAYGPGSVKDSVYKKTEQDADILINEKRADWNKQRELYERDMNNVIAALRPFVPGAGKDPEEMIVALLQGGDAAVNNFRTSLSRVKREDGSSLTEDEIDGYLGDMVASAMHRLVMRPTGQFGVNVKNPQQMIPLFDFDVNALGSILGYGDKNREALVRKTIGKERHDVAMAMFRFMKNKDGSVMGMPSVTGIPRNFSVESYISRFYAVNRDVIGPQYVITESILQRMRIANFSVIQAALTDPKVGKAFVDMLESGKPLSVQQELEFVNGLVVAFVKAESTFDRPRDVGPPKEVMFPGMSGVRLKMLTDPMDYSQTNLPVFPFDEFYPEFAYEQMRRNPKNIGVVE